MQRILLIFGMLLAITTWEVNAGIMSVNNLAQADAISPSALVAQTQNASFEMGLSQLSSYTAWGYAYLENATNHANIKVKFHPISPSAVLDSTYSDATGYWSLPVEPGIYTVTYEKTNYQTFQLASNLTILADMNVGTGTILQLGTNVAGNVEGIWSGVYAVNGDIIVPEGDSLIIQAGTLVRFMGNYHLKVYGYLDVQGVEGNGVVFKSSPLDQIELPGQWQGIDFYDVSNDNSAIRHATIKNAVDGVYLNNSKATLNHLTVMNCSESGIQLDGDGSNPVISYCDLSYCNEGLYVSEGQPTVSYIYAHHNSTYGFYWYSNAYGSISACQASYNNSYGFYLYYYAAPTIDSCMSTYNNSWGIRVEAYGSPTISNCYVAYNNGYGISMYNDGYSWHSPIIEDCLIENNTSWGLMLRYYMTDASIIRNNLIQHNGGGIYIYYQIRGQFYGNSILANSNAGLYVENGYNDIDFHHNLIAYNTGDGIYKNGYSSYTNFTFNTIYENNGDGLDNNNTASTTSFSHNIVSNNNGYGIRGNSILAEFEYNDVYSNGLGEIQSSSVLPANAWNFVSFTAQADTADIYLNFSEDPLFSFEIDSTDLSLSYLSPCINVGDPLITDADGTVADIGAYYFDAGNPHDIWVEEAGDQFVTISWEAVANDSLDSYRVYSRLSGTGAYSLVGSTSQLTKQVTGLTNNSLYDFVVSGVYPSYESGYSVPVSGTPGLAQVLLTPGAVNLTVLTDTVTQLMEVNNNGSKELELVFPEGMAAGAAHFDGYYDYLHNYDQAHLESFTSMTIETWIKREANGHIEFISKHYRQYSVFINEQNKLGLYKGYTSDWYQTIVSSYELPLNEWHHVAIVWEGTSVKFYVDAVLVDEVFDISDNPIPNLGYYFMVGCRANDYNYWFTGFLSEVRVWNIARTEDDIRRNYMSALDGSESGLVAYYPLHTDYTDHSPFAYSPSVNGNMYLSTEQVSSFEAIPHIFPNGLSYTVAPGGTLNIPVKYYPTGQSGTYLYHQPVISNDASMPFFEYDIAITYGQTVPSTPVHFDPVTETGLPYSIIITNAEIDDATLAIGDEIGIYDGNTCVGAGIFNGSFNFVVTVWEAAPPTAPDGFTDGNPIHFVIYDASADLEAVVTAQYEVGDGTFGYGQFTVVNLTSSVFQTQEIILPGNMFNLISFNKLPRYSNSSVIFESLENLQIVYNDQGFALIPPYSINTLGDIYFKDGFHVYTSITDTLYYEGTRINPYEWPILVESGRWSSIAYLGESAMDPEDAIEASLVDSIDIMQSSDGGAWIPSLSLNTLGNLTPGKGYQIALSSVEDIQITYQTNNLSSGKVFDILEQPVHFQFEKTGLPYQIVIETSSFQAAGIARGDEIAVFDGNQCVGAAVYQGESRMLLTSWSSDEQISGMKGFKPGALMKFKAYTISGEIDLVPISQNSLDNFHFKASNYAHISFEFTEGAVACSVYPNPFNENTTINVSITSEMPVEVRIADLSGRVLVSFAYPLLETGDYSWIWDGKDAHGNLLPTGVYLIDIQTGTSVYTQKLVRTW